MCIIHTLYFEKTFLLDTTKKMKKKIRNIAKRKKIYAKQEYTIRHKVSNT